MILIKTLFLNLIPEEVTVVEPDDMVGEVVNLFYVFIFIYRTWIVASAVLVVNKEPLSPLATKLLPTHLIDRNRHHLPYIITVDAEAIVGLLPKSAVPKMSSRVILRFLPSTCVFHVSHLIELTVHDYMLPKQLKCKLPVPQQSRESSFHHQDFRPCTVYRNVKNAGPFFLRCFHVGNI